MWWQPIKRTDKKMRVVFRGLLAVLALSIASRADAQQYFGMNQVQYKHFKWRVLETEHFTVHYYPEERAAVMDAARMAERSYARLSRILGHQFREKKPIILFASRADFAQNNVTGDLGEGVGGVTESQRHRLIHAEPKRPFRRSPLSLDSRAVSDDTVAADDDCRQRHQTQDHRRGDDTVFMCSSFWTDGASLE